MCGIAGIYAPRGASMEALDGMAQRLLHRGPDGQGFLVSDASQPLRAHRSLGACDRPSGGTTVGLAHRRLTIIDLSDDSAQPFVSADGNTALVYNGEIYNYVELREELRSLGHEFRTSGDTEVLLNSYLEWGPRCVERFVGMWAFAVLDLSSRRLLLSRDRFGIKPLYYAPAGDALVFASEIKALFEVPGVAREPDEGTVGKFLLNGIVDDTEHTFFAGVKRLLPAHNLSGPLDAPALELRLERYWSPPSTAAANRNSAGEAVEHFRTTFRDAVRVHARSDVPVGTCLSGGLDSSSIVCVAEELRRQDAIPSYTHAAFGYVPPTTELSERMHMTTVANSTGADLTYVEPTYAQLVASLPEIIRQQDEPFGSASIAAQWWVFRAAREAGVKVMLDGQGADETLGGYHHYLQLIAGRLLRERRPLEYLRFHRLHARYFGRPPLAFADIAVLLLPARIRALATSALARMQTTALGRTPIPQSFVSSDLRARSRHVPPGTHPPTSLEGALRLHTTSIGLPSLLRFEDRNSMAHSIEARVPFLDHRLVELAFRLPSALKVRGVTTKWLLREAMRGTLPDEIRQRRDKLGFRADPSMTWSVAREHRDALVSNQTAFEESWFEPSAIAGLIDRGEGNAETETLLWRLLNVKLWAREHWGEGARL